MNKTGIEYLDYTWNPTHGCSAVSPGCDNCWAKRTAERLAKIKTPGYHPLDPFMVRYNPKRLEEPLNKKGPLRIGVSFMGDLFHPLVAVESVRRIFQIMMTANHNFFVLTKRPERMAKILNLIFERVTLKQMENIWFGITAENQEMADQRLPVLLDLPVTNKWASIEPMLGPVDIYEYMIPDADWVEDEDGFINTCLRWVVCGGESGPAPRPMAIDWAKSLNSQCKKANVPFMFKQMMQNGKKISGPRLNGRAYMDMPQLSKELFDDEYLPF